MKKILFPTDFSETSHNAFLYACALAKKIDVKIDVISIFHLPTTYVTDLPPDYFPRLIEEQRDILSEQLDEFINTGTAELVELREVIYGVFFPQEIISFAKENEHDLIIMGTKGKHDVFDKILGSITTQTMMQSPCPVLAIPAKADYKVVEKIAYATDFHKNDAHSVEKLVKIAKALSADTLFVHVEKDAAIGKAGDIIDIQDYPFEYTDFSIINNHSVQDGLDKYIVEKEIDWLSLFIPRRRLWEKLFHSNFSKKMLFHAHKPILVFHE